MYLRADRAALKRAAKNHLRQADPRPWKVVLLYLLLSAGITLALNTLLGTPWMNLLNTVAAAVNAGYSYQDAILIMGEVSQRQSAQGALTLLLNILLQLYTTVLAFGFVAYNLRRTRGEESGAHDLLCGFGTVSRVVGMSVIVFFFRLGWSFLVMAPLMMFLMFGAVFAAVAMSVLMSQAGFWVIIGAAYLFVIAGMVLVQYLCGRYALSSRLLLDHPDWGALDAVRRSRELLRGRLGEVFKLELSFLGWALLHMALVVGAGVLAARLFQMAGVNPMASEWLLAVIHLLAAFPVGLWLLPYYQGVISEYYLFLVNRPRPGPELKDPAAGLSGPESF